MVLRVGALVVAMGLFVLAWNAGDRSEIEDPIPSIPGIAPGDIAAVRRALRDIASLQTDSGPDSQPSWTQLSRLYELQLKINDWSGAAQTCLVIKRSHPELFELMETRATVDALHDSPHPLANLDAMQALPQETWIKMLLEFTRRAIIRDDDQEARKLVARIQSGARNQIAPEEQARLLDELRFYQAALNQRDDAMETLAKVHRLSKSRGSAPISPTVLRQIAEKIDPVAIRSSMKKGRPRIVESLNIEESDLTVSKNADETWPRVIAREVVDRLRGDAVATAFQILDTAKRKYLIERDGYLRLIAEAYCEAATDATEIESLSRKLGIGNDREQKLLSEIARSVSRRGDCKRGEELAGLIANPSRRTQAILEVATMLAREGRLDEALKLAESMKPPQMWDDASGVTDREPFDFRIPTTWVKPYEWFPGKPELSNDRARHFAADLAYSAMGFHMAMGGKDREQLRTLFADLRDSFGISGDSILEQIIIAQAEAGDITGSLRWCAEIRKMPSSKMENPPDGFLRNRAWLIRYQYVNTTLGVAEGLLNRKDRVRLARR